MKMNEILVHSWWFRFSFVPPNFPLDSVECSFSFSGVGSPWTYNGGFSFWQKVNLISSSFLFTFYFRKIERKIKICSFFSRQVIFHPGRGSRSHCVGDENNLFIFLLVLGLSPATCASFEMEFIMWVVYGFCIHLNFNDLFYWKWIEFSVLGFCICTVSDDFLEEISIMKAFPIVYHRADPSNRK